MRQNVSSLLEIFQKHGYVPEIGIININSCFYMYLIFVYPSHLSSLIV